MMTDTQMIIDFDKWCPLCKYKGRASIDYPCDSCLEHPTAWNSERPVLFQEASTDSRKNPTL